MARSFVCLAAVACSCLAVLVLPAQGRAGLGLAAGFRGKDHLLSEPQFHVTEQEEEQRGVTMKARPSWSSSAAGWVRPELRSVPAGPDPMHHHGSPRRPEQERATP
ncbi:protein FLORAL ORGAN NUMBER2-like [Phragmites australis]|uniref:protein FLORAL ORGAN NUMBER2-like n=1 Tax=Phragmites australis TaxID=29695 RepID=UPI002D76A4B8|nr:protein FLORAL ORGAN NUMBER2-like [Phragmites australis]